MDWANERWVRLYTRDTTTWKMLDWRARTVLMHLLRKVDRAGVLEIGETGTFGLAAVLELPLEVVEPGIERLLHPRLRVVVETPTAYVLPNFLDAQEAIQTTNHRSAEYRARKRDFALAAAKPVIAELVRRPDPAALPELPLAATVTPRDENVTRRHATSRDVEPAQLAGAEPADPAELAPDPEPECVTPRDGAITPRDENVTARHGSSLLSDPIQEEELSPAGARAIPPSTEHGVPPAPPAAPEPLTPAARDHADRRRHVLAKAWADAGREFMAVQAEGIDPEAPNMWGGLPDALNPSMVNLRGIVDGLLIGERPDYDRASEVILRRIRNAGIEARQKRTIVFLAPAWMWRPESFEIAAAMSPQQAARGPRAGPQRSAGRAYADPQPERKNRLKPM